MYNNTIILIFVYIPNSLSYHAVAPLVIGKDKVEFPGRGHEDLVKHQTKCLEKSFLYFLVIPPGNEVNALSMICFIASVQIARIAMYRVVKF